MDCCSMDNLFLLSVTHRSQSRVMTWWPRHILTTTRVWGGFLGFLQRWPLGTRYSVSGPSLLFSNNQQKSKFCLPSTRTIHYFALKPVRDLYTISPISPNTWGFGPWHLGNGRTPESPQIHIQIRIRFSQNVWKPSTVRMEILAISRTRISG